MFEGEDRQAFQTLIDTWTITSKDMKPRVTLDAIITTIKSKEPFWAHRDKLISNIRQQPSKGIHALSQLISNLITKCKFPYPKTQEMLKIMLLQHAVHYHEARDWIRQRTSPSSPIRPSSHTVSSWSLGVRCTERLGRGDMPI